jgi:mono/diheme cytochrome c family protein
MYIPKMTLLKSKFTYLIAGITFLTSCGGSDKPGVEYAANMYHSVAYEPLSQITDKDAGLWVNSSGIEGRGEYYNSNPYNKSGMNMRLPVKGTIPRRAYLTTDSTADVYFVARTIPRDCVALSARILRSPLAKNDKLLSEGQALYVVYCSPCHGEAGKGDGLVGKKYGGVPASFSSGKYATLSEGHIYHVITNGYNRMWPYASQVNPEERWKIVQYVQTLQKQ